MSLAQSHLRSAVRTRPSRMWRAIGGGTTFQHSEKPGTKRGTRRMNSEVDSSDGVAIGSIVIRCYEFDRMRAFWREALHYDVVHADPNGGFVILGDPRGRGANVSLDQSPEKRAGKRGWIHLDLYTKNQPSEVERLVGIGARRYPWKYGPHADYVVLEDPDGNLFCVVQIPEEGSGR